MKIGTKPEELPLNQFLGSLAYKDSPLVPTPASASAAGNEGEIACDGSYLYICTDVDTWVRVAVATWS
jgi:hypothetical protein